MVQLVAGLVLGAVILYLVLAPKLKQTAVLNEHIEKQNEKFEIDNMVLQEKNKHLLSEQLDLSNKILDLTLQVTQTESEIKAAKQIKEEILQSINDIKIQQQESIDKIYEAQVAAMQEKLDGSAQQLGKNYQDMAQEYEQTYLKALEESAEEFAAAMTKRSEELSLIEEELENLRAKRDAAIEALKREEDKRLQLDKYKILLTEADLSEIKRLREITPYFRNPRPIAKAIWESYYRTPTTELVNRVVGAATHAGIYKLTNLTNGYIYIGQAVNLGDRLKDHVKAGIGIDTPNSKLYVAMKEVGVENFSYEVIEKCTADQLNDREKYWIDYYRSQEVGYNMRQGGARK